MFKFVDESVTPVDDHSPQAVADGRGWAMVKVGEEGRVLGRYASKGAAARAVNRRNNEIADTGRKP